MTKPENAAAALDTLANHDAAHIPPSAAELDRHPWLRHIDAQQRQLDAVLVHQRTVAHQIADLSIRQQRADAHQVTTDQRLDRVDAQLVEVRSALQAHIVQTGERFDHLEGGQAEMLRAIRDNTEITSQVRDAVTAARLASRLAKWAVPLVALASGLIGLWLVVRGGVGTD